MPLSTGPPRYTGIQGVLKVRSSTLYVCVSVRLDLVSKLFKQQFRLPV